MKLYATPGGTWAGNEKDWKAAMRAEGIDLKNYKGRVTVEVPTDKPRLLEFLTFNHINIINPRPQAVDVIAPAGVTPDTPTPPADRNGSSTTVPLDELFDKAPVRQQLRLAVSAIDAATALLA
jgi:hypothetical protein